ncbi:MAG: nitroreductase [Roseibium sp.]
MSSNTPGSPETLQFLRKRRSHPAVTMSAPGPDDAELADLLTIAARVPDHGKIAPWRFIVYSQANGEDIGKALLDLYEGQAGSLDAAQKEKELTRFTRAPVIVGVVSSAADHPKIPVWEQQLSVGAVCMNLITAAAAAGYASQWLTEWYSFDDEASRFLGTRIGERFAGFIHIGTATQSPVERPRPDVTEITSNWMDAK